VYAILEHVFADKDIIILFDGWKRDPQLQQAYEAAYEFAKKELKEIPDELFQHILRKGKV
jgi:hypothetical protein